MDESVLDASVLIDVIAGLVVPAVEQAIADGSALLPPLVIAELVTGASTPEERERIAILLQDADMLETSLEHWMNVGFLRQRLRQKGLNVTLPDAHIAQCALDRDATLISRDAIFARIAQHTSLRLAGG